MFMICACLLFFSTMQARVSASDTPAAPIAGLLDLRQWDFKQPGLVPLSGEWEFYPNQLLADPTSAATAQVVSVPHVWNGDIRGQGHAGFGIGSYRLEVLLPPHTPSLGVSFRTVSSAYQLYANGVQVSSVGEAGLTAADTSPAYRPQVVRLPDNVQALHLVVAASNFEHARGGLWDTILLGPYDALQDQFLRNLDIAMFLATAALLLGLYHLMIWSLRREDVSFLVFGLLGLALAVRTLFINEMYVLQLFPDLAYEWQLCIEYQSMILLVGLSVLFVAVVFPDDYPRRLLWFLEAPLLLYLLLVWTAPVAWYTSVLWMFHALVVVCVFCTMFVVVRAVREQRYGARLYGLSIAVVALFILYDVFNTVFPQFLGLYVHGDNHYLLPLGFLAVLFTQGFLLAKRSGYAMHTLEVRTRELSLAHQRLDLHAQELEQRVAERTAELETANAKLDKMARIDGLTKLANRRHFDERLSEALSDHVRSGQPLSLVLVDVDQFKAYNDNYGHVQGDVALQKVANAMSAAVKRPTDLVARYGGEEMAALLPNTDRDGAVSIAEKMRKQVEALRISHEPSDHKNLTISLGVASMTPQSGQRPENLIQLADEALYRAKSGGRNQLCS